MDMIQSFVMHIRKDVRGEIKTQRKRHPKLLTDREKRRCVTLVLNVNLEIHMQQQNNFDMKQIYCCLASL